MLDIYVFIVYIVKTQILQSNFIGKKISWHERCKKKNHNLKLQTFWLPGTSEAQFLIFHVPQKSGFWIKKPNNLKLFGSNKIKGSKQDRQNRLMSPISEGGEHSHSPKS
jgi:hypothetical protein